MHSVTCVDLTPAMISVGKEQAEKQKLRNMVFVLGDVNELLFLDNSFDMVISRPAFHHFADVNRAFFQCVVLIKGNRELLFLK